MPTDRPTMIRRIGKVLIYAGVAVWGVYLVLLLLGRHPEGSTFLPFHLLGVIPGAILNRWHQIRRLWARP